MARKRKAAVKVESQAPSQSLEALTASEETEKKPSDETERDEPTSPKKAKTTTQKRVKGKKGAMKKILELPIELIQAVHLLLARLCDLYTLSLVNKEFRERLIRRSSLSIWDDAASRAGLPQLECPMSHGQLARLVTAKHCYHCGKLARRSPCWAQRRLLCKAHQEELVISIDDMEALGPEHPFTKHIFQIDYWDEDVSPDRKLLLSQAQFYVELFNEAFPVPEEALMWDADCGAWIFADGLVPLEGVERWDERTEEVQIEFVQGPIQCEGAFFFSLMANLSRTDQDAMALFDWEAEQKIRRQQELEAIRQSRLNDIEGRLLELGWKEELEQTGWICNRPSVATQAVPLTDQIFQNILPELEQHLQAVRHEEQRRRQLLVETELRHRLLHFLYGPYIETAKEEKGLILPRNLFLALSCIRVLWEGQQALPSNLLTAQKDNLVAEALVCTREGSRHLARLLIAAYKQAEKLFPDLDYGVLKEYASAKLDVETTGRILRNSHTPVCFHSDIGSASISTRNERTKAATVPAAIKLCMREAMHDEPLQFLEFDTLFASFDFRITTFVSATFEVFPREVIVAAIIRKALQGSGVSVRAATSSRDDGFWWCPDCVFRIPNNELRSHLFNEHLYSARPANERPKAWETDDLKFLRKKAILPELRYEPSTDPIVIANRMAAVSDDESPEIEGGQEGETGKADRDGSKPIDSHDEDVKACE